MDQLIAAQIRKLQQKGLYRERAKPFVAPANSLNFCSNDYLSLSTDPRLKQAYQDGFARYPCGSGGSAVISGYHPAHRQLEETIAAALGVDDAILFSSGYAANLAIVTLLASLSAHVLIDKGVHASIYDGLNLAGAKYSRYRHRSLAGLETALKRASTHAVVLTEGLFSMSGQIASLDPLMALCHQYTAHCIVDEAHSFGLLGPQGLGLINASGLSQDDIPLRLLAFGKALAGQGAVVAGKKAWIDALLQQGRSYIYSTALSPALAHGMKRAFELVIAADDRRLKLNELVRYFQECCKNSSQNWQKSLSPIQQLQLGCPHQARKLADHLLIQGIFCQAIRQPTVNRQETGLRVVLNYSHTKEDIDRLFWAAISNR